MESIPNYSYTLHLGKKYSEMGEYLEDNNCLVDVDLDDIDDLGDINSMIIQNDNNDYTGFGNAEDGYYVILKIFKPSDKIVNLRHCYIEVNKDDFLNVVEERLRYHCPEAFDD